MASKVGVFGPGTLMKTVNDREVCNLDDVREALKHPVSGAHSDDERMFISFMSKNNDFVVLDMFKALAEEEHVGFGLSLAFAEDQTSCLMESGIWP